MCYRRLYRFVHMRVGYSARPSKSCARCAKELFPYNRSRDVADHCTGCALRVQAEQRAVAAAGI